jgi:hypothetical protein
MILIMAPKSKSKRSDPEEYRRFVATARKLGVDESPEAMEQAFRKVIDKSKRSNPKGGSKGGS